MVLYLTVLDVIINTMLMSVSKRIGHIIPLLYYYRRMWNNAIKLCVCKFSIRLKEVF